MNRWFYGIGFIGVVVAGLGIAGVRSGLGHESRPDTPRSESEPADGADEQAISVKTVRPKYDPDFKATVEQPAFANSYDPADLEARAAGPVKFITVAIGDWVKEGQKLVEIDVPDVVQDVALKAAFIQQRQQEKLVAEAAVRVAQARISAAESTVQEKKAYVEAKDAWLDFKGKEYARFKKLGTTSPPAVPLDVVDERYKDYLVAKAEKSAAEVSVQKAQADLLEAKEHLVAAQADVTLKEELIHVAEADHKRAQAILSLATIEAPFDGKVTRRDVDPGTFVHNASTAVQSRPVLRVERTDIITVYMKVPDKYAPYVTPDTEAIIQMNELPDYVIRGKVTRQSDSLQTREKDRTMRVEVDLYNGSKQEYDRFLEKAQATNRAGLKGGKLPMFPSFSGKADAKRPVLMPGMYGTMRLVLNSFNNPLILPSNAVISRGGKPYIFVAQDGTARLVPVSVQLDNGTEAKLTVLKQVNGQQVSQDLTGTEEVIVSNQGELSDGQKVRSSSGN